MINIDTDKQKSASLTVAGGGQHDERREEAADNKTRGKVGARETTQGTTQAQGTTQVVDEVNSVRQLETSKLSSMGLPVPELVPVPVLRCAVLVLVICAFGYYVCLIHNSAYEL